MEGSHSFPRCTSAAHTVAADSAAAVRSRWLTTMLPSMSASGGCPPSASYCETKAADTPVGGGSVAEEEEVEEDWVRPRVSVGPTGALHPSAPPSCPAAMCMLPGMSSGTTLTTRAAASPPVDEPTSTAPPANAAAVAAAPSQATCPAEPPSGTSSPSLLPAA